MTDTPTNPARRFAILLVALAIIGFSTLVATELLAPAWMAIGERPIGDGIALRVVTHRNPDHYNRAVSWEAVKNGERMADACGFLGAIDSTIPASRLRAEWVEIGPAQVCAFGPQIGMIYGCFDLGVSPPNQLTLMGSDRARAMDLAQKACGRDLVWMEP